MGASPYPESDILRLFGNTAASQTDEAIRAALTGRRLRVLGGTVVVGGTATNVTFNSKPSGSGVAISPLYALGANGGMVLPFNPHGYFETAPGEGLSITTGAGATVGWLLTVAVIGTAGSGSSSLLDETAMGDRLLAENGESLFDEAA
jgi:hypothetical protein